MKISRMTLLALAAAAVASGASAAQVEFGGYFRSGAGSSDQGGKEVCFRLPGSIVWFRLGNECDTYAALNFGATLGTVDGTTFKTKFTTAYGTQQMANWEQTTPAFREAFVEATNIGASMGMPALNGATLWAGKRFYKNPDIHMLDYTYWEVGMGPGFGIDNVDAGAAGKFSYALFRVGDFTGYGINTSLGGYNPDLIGGGSRTATVHDFRLQDIAANPGGKITLGADIVVKNNRSGKSTYTHDVVQPITVDGKTYDVVVRKTETIDNGAGRNGLGLTLTHRQDNLLGLGGFNDVTLQFAHDAAALKGFGFAGSNDKRREWLLFDHWVMEPTGMPVTMSATIGLRNATVNDKNVKDFWVGARPQYHLNNVWSLMAEAGYQQVKPEGEATRKLAKLTLGTQFSMGKSLWSRPSIRFYATHAKWNSAASAAGAVACTGRDCNTAADGYADKRNGTGYGVQVEAWF